MDNNKLYQKLIYKIFYARWLQNVLRREDWKESVERYKSFLIKRIKDKKAKEEFEKACEFIMDVKIAPSMRAFWTAGKALDKDNIAAYNCCFVSVDNIKVFSEILYILMCGTGVGFSVEQDEICKLPKLPTKIEDCDDVIIFSDSKKGWADGYNRYLKNLYKGKNFKYDVSKLRLEGSILKTFGGRASGPAPLISLLENTKKIVMGAVGRQLYPIECHDIICHIAASIVSGGVRRSACVSLSDLSDDSMSRAKVGEFWRHNTQRRLANNSAVYNIKPDIIKFIDEWKKLIESKCGERGIFNRTAVKYTVAKNGRRDPDHKFGSNPCFTKDMQLLTETGYKRFDELSKLENVNLINEKGEISKGRIWSTGIKPVYKIVFTGKKESIKCTENHEFKLNDGSSCLAKDLKGKRLMPFFNVKNTFNRNDFYAGFILGDGSVKRLNSKIHKGMEVHIGKNDLDVAKLLGIEYGRNYNREAKKIALEYKLEPLSYEDKRLPSNIKITDDFLSGLFSANGSVIESVGRIAYKTTSKVLANQLVKELNDREIKSYITTNKSHDVKHHNGVYNSKQSYDVNVSNFESIVKFSELISFAQKYKQEKLRKAILSKSITVRAVKYLREEEVFDFSESKTHWGVVNGVIAHNCGEIILRPKQFCNLSEVILRPKDGKEDIKEKVKYATILGCIQSTLTDFNFISKRYKDNCKDERLLGVSLTGLADHPILNTVNKTSKKWLYEMKEEAIETAKRWSGILGIKMPAAITCVKPSGTVSQLVGCSSGIHPRYAPYYIRRIRLNSFDPISKFLIDQNIKYAPEIGETIDSATTFVFDFYMKSPKESLMKDSVTALQQLEYWKMLKEYWCEHNPSCTIYVKKDEWLEVASWIYKNWNIVCGLSFLPYDTGIYQLAPFEEIDEETYEELSKNINIDFDKLIEYEKNDTTTGSQEFACIGGACEI